MLEPKRVRIELVLNPKSFGANMGELMLVRHGHTGLNQPGPEIWTGFPCVAVRQPEHSPSSIKMVHDGYYAPTTGR
jgi:hypothetical protein